MAHKTQLIRPSVPSVVLNSRRGDSSPVLPPKTWNEISKAPRNSRSMFGQSEVPEVIQRDMRPALSSALRTGDLELQCEAKHADDGKLGEG